MKILLRDLDRGQGLPSGIDQSKLIVDLGRVPIAGEEIHWPEHIAKVWKTMHFPDPEEGAAVACCYVVNPDHGLRSFGS